jgi:hypothetical protein
MVDGFGGLAMRSGEGWGGDLEGKARDANDHPAERLMKYGLCPWLYLKARCGSCTCSCMLPPNPKYICFVHYITALYRNSKE